MKCEERVAFVVGRHVTWIDCPKDVQHYRVHGGKFKVQRQTGEEIEVTVIWHTPEVPVPWEKAARVEGEVDTGEYTGGG